MKALMLMHGNLRGASVRLFDEANADLVRERLGGLGFTSRDGAVWSRAIAGAPEATAWIVDVGADGFTIDGGAGPLEAQLFEQTFVGFDLLATLNVEQPAWYSKYLASVAVDSVAASLGPALAEPLPVEPLPPV